MAKAGDLSAILRNCETAGFEGVELQTGHSPTRHNIRHTNLETEDIRAVHTGGRDWIGSRGTVIRYNYFHDMLGFGKKDGKWVRPYQAEYSGWTENSRMWKDHFPTMLKGYAMVAGNGDRSRGTAVAGGHHGERRGGRGANRGALRVAELTHPGVRCLIVKRAADSANAAICVAS